MAEAFDTGGAAAARPPELRIGDAERQSVIDQLRIHTGAGRLTLDEFSERVDLAWRATTGAELAPLLADLPSPRPDPPSGPPPPPSTSATAPPPPTAAAPAATVPPASGSAALPPTAPPVPAAAAGRRSVVAVMSGANIRGRWQVAPELAVTAFWGSARLDFRQAVISSGVVDLRIAAIMGSVMVIVPEGIPVEMHGGMLMGSCVDRVNVDLAMPGAPLLRVHVGGFWGSVLVRSKPNKTASADPDDDDRSSRLDEHLDRLDDHLDKHLHRHDHRDRRPRPPRPPRPPRQERPVPPTLPPIPYPFPPPPPSTGDRAPSEVTVPPRGAPLDLPEGTLTMLFTDIVDSTSTAERLGDQRWASVIDHHDRTVRAVVAGHSGTVVKGSGDGYLIVFASARQAVLAAIAIQRAAASPDAAGPEGPIVLRAGLHTGEVVQRDGDVFGRNVIAASRIASEAEAGQVLVSALTKELVESSGDLAFSEGVEVSLRGLARPWTLHEVHRAASVSPGQT